LDHIDVRGESLPCAARKATIPEKEYWESWSCNRTVKRLEGAFGKVLP